MTDKVRLVVLFGGRSAEHEVSCITAAHVLRALDADRYDVVPIGISPDGRWVRPALPGGVRSLPTALPTSGTEVEPLPTVTAGDDQTVVVLPLLHGPFGEDGTVQGLLELAGVPFVGAGVLGSALAMDKAKAKEVLVANGLPVPRWRSFRAEKPEPGLLWEVADDLGWPVFVKPSNLGSSVGVSKARDPDELLAAAELALSYDEWVVVEEAIAGRELEVAVLGNDEPEASVPGEVVPSHEFYDYEDKYLEEGARLLIPAPVPDAVADESRELARAAFGALRAEGLARVDFFFEEGGRGLLVNEVNTMPGFTPISMYPKLWEASGLAYHDLLDRLVALAVERHQRRVGRVGRGRD